MFVLTFSAINILCINILLIPLKREQNRPRLKVFSFEFQALLHYVRGFSIRIFTNPIFTNRGFAISERNYSAIIPEVVIVLPKYVSNS